VKPDSSSNRLAQAAVAIVAVGFVIFVIGLFPSLIQLDMTSGIGLVQISVFLLGLMLMTLGSYIYLYATRHRARPTRLREDIGVRLMATGVIIACASGFADVLGIGSHYGIERPLFGPLQAAGVALSMLVIVVGIFLYSHK
jgi:amino acid transporter